MNAVMPEMGKKPTNDIELLKFATTSGRIQSAELNFDFSVIYI